MNNKRGNGLTERQKAVLLFICRYAQENGFAPAVRDIGGSFNIAPSSALDYLKALERKGFIRRLAHKPRCLEVIKRVDE